MTISEFYTQFKDEETCRNHLKQRREWAGITCKKCSGTAHYWLKAKAQWQCKSCDFRTTLRSGTLFESSKLPIKTWYQALYLVSNTKKGISACELQRQLGLKRNEPAWYMLHKIRKTMAHINEDDQLSGKIDLDDCCLTTVNEKEPIPLKNETGPPVEKRQQRALVMVESSYWEGSVFKKKCGKLRMLALEYLDQDTRWPVGYRNQKIMFPHRQGAPVFESSHAHILLPWVQTAMSNIKRLINGIYHHISTKFTQLYYDEFAFKFNYRSHKSKWSVVLAHGIKPYW